ncbi:DUF4178 domain-containing protein [Flavobacterium crassostreae]|uniref:DUF4178 domain-containing protein n=1 Tax=Flavobacterium crassostreae TaxID=1763534 RepID=A0A1B9E5G5_9FLAO|nr:DUF4178 domain-containing protein [Flavobacterium crassostreae]OCB77204.1 hypothetical protein LPBF_04175 [Flavobacterium crassostreae]
MTVTCFNCNTTTTLDVPFLVAIFACPHCTYVYKNTRDVGLKFNNRFKSYYYDQTFVVGKTATFNNQEYTITGILIKACDGFEWKEYILINKKEEFLYLSESSGHWIILHEIEFQKKVGNHPLTLEYEDKLFDRYNYCYPTLISAQGFFDFDIYSNFELIEYICPPLLVSFEKKGPNQTAFLGKHISRKEIKRAFHTNNTLAAKSGVGMVQPFLFNIGNLALICCCFALLILFTHWYTNINRMEQNVLNTEMAFEHYANKDYITPSFVLKGSSAPLSIRVHTNVDNSWANVQVALINEKTNEETYASKDIEYYHGYADGESWTEGSVTEKLNICGVGPGKYHLSITPTKAVEDVQNQTLQIQATWSKPSYRNVYMTFLFMIVFVVAMFYLDKNFENKRWEE